MSRSESSQSYSKWKDLDGESLMMKLKEATKRLLMFSWRRIEFLLLETFLWKIFQKDSSGSSSRLWLWHFFTEDSFWLFRIGWWTVLTESFVHRVCIFSPVSFFVASFLALLFLYVTFSVLSQRKCETETVIHTKREPKTLTRFLSFICEARKTREGIHENGKLDDEAVRERTDFYSISFCVEWKEVCESRCELPSNESWSLNWETFFTSVGFVPSFLQPPFLSSLLISWDFLKKKKTWIFYHVICLSFLNGRHSSWKVVYTPSNTN